MRTLQIPTVAINVIITDISFVIPIHITLKGVCHVRTVVTLISKLIIVAVCL